MDSSFKSGPYVLVKTKWSCSDCEMKSELHLKKKKINRKEAEREKEVQMLMSFKLQSAGWSQRREMRDTCW